MSSITNKQTHRRIELLGIGDHLGGRYALIRRLGQGGFATVWEAEDVSAGGRVAVRIVSDDRRLDPDVVARFGQEVEVLRELRHPNTVQVWDVGLTDEGSVFMVMELVSGGTLAELIQKEGALPAPRAMAIMEQILGALAEAHARGIIHRDLKPQNINIRHLPGDPEFVKILDFGVAKVLADDLASVETRAGVVFGTPGYTAPEVLMGEPVTPAADVYSAGLILAEMLLGEPVVAQGSAPRMVTHQLALDPDHISGELGELRASPVILKAINKNNAERYPNAGDMLAALRAVMEGRDATIAVVPADRSRSTQTDRALDAEANRMLRAVNIYRRPWETVVWLALSALAVVAIFGLAFWPDRPAVGDEEVAKLDWMEASRATSEKIPPVQSNDAPIALVSLRDLPGSSVDSLNWDWLEPSPVATDADRAPPRRRAARDELEATLSATSPAAQEEQVQPVPRGLIFDAAAANQEAIDLLEWAVSEGQIEPDRNAEASAQLLELYQSQVEQLLTGQLCTAAEQRVERVRSRLELFPVGSESVLTSMATAVERCHLAPRPVAERLEPATFLAHIRDASTLYEQARQLTEPSRQEQRNGLLEASLREHLQANWMLSDALADPFLSVDHRAEMSQNLRWLTARIVVIESLLDRCASAELHMAETQGDAGTLSDEDQLATADLRAHITSCRQRAASQRVGFSWDVFAGLLMLSQSLFAQAEQILQTIVPEPAPPEPPVYIAEVRISSEPSRASIRIDGESYGRTPFVGTIEADQTDVVLTIRRSGYQRQRVRLDLADAEIQHHIELERENPFGGVQPMREQLGSRRRAVARSGQSEQGAVDE